MAIVRRAALASFATLLWAGQLAAQGGTISGQVTDALTSRPIVGARVEIVGTRRGISSGDDGRYLLTDVPAGSHQVTARYIGYAPVTQTVTVTARQVAIQDFALERQAAVMDEIVVTGYGAQRRAEITGSIATVNADQANVGVITNADELLQGRVSGVNITENSGEPGAGAKIRIRGGTSISASNEPLYVIDGVAVSGVSTEAAGEGIGGDATLPRNPLNLINPSDIESITVLKDAAAAAIYGARGANGVILIETKQGARGRMTFEYDGYVSMASRARSLDLVTAEQYRQFIQDQVPGQVGTLGSANTDWQQAVHRSALTHNHNLVFSGGTENSLYRATLNYMNQEGVALSSGLERFQARLNGTQYAWNDRLQLRLNLNASHVRNDYLPFQDGGGFEGDVFHNMVSFNPTQPVRVADSVTGEELFYELGSGRQSVRNPVGVAEQILDFANTTRVLGNIRTQLDIVPNVFNAQVIVGVDRSESTRRIYFPGASPVGAEWNGRALQKSRELTAVNFQGLLTLTQRFGEANQVEAVGGYEVADFDRDDFSAEARDFLTDAFTFDNLAAGNELVPQSSYREDRRLIGLFTRVTVGLNDRYFITGVLRRDGSSVFGPENKWGTFPALSASWRIGQESFMRDGMFSEFRLRAGYGVQGQEAVVPYGSQSTLSPGDRYAFGDQAIVGVAPNRNPNPALKWEKTTQFNVAVDYGLSDNRISGSLEYYIKNTSDLLLEVPVPQPGAVENRFENVGKVRNNGLEATLDALLITKPNMTWQAGIVFAAEKNEVKDLGPHRFIRTAFVSGRGQTGQVSQRILPGHPLGTFFGPEYVGVDDQGRQLFNDYEVEVDDEGNETSRTLVGTTTAPGGDDFVVIGDANPDFSLGFRSSLTVGRFDASFLARAKVGQDVFNNTALVYSTKSAALQGQNFLASALTDSIDIDEPAIYSSRWIESGSFLRLENITLGFTFNVPEFLGTGRTARLYVSGDNLLLLTGYSGYDPESHTDRGNLAVRGIDYLAYPRARSFTTGIRVAF
jgi:iron complex outermembrane receptor protein